MTDDDKKLLINPEFKAFNTVGAADTYNGREFFMPFSPIIMQSTAPKKFIDIINRVGDDVLNDDKKSEQWDWSNNLVGKVHKEIQIPISNKEEKKYLANIMKQACLDFLNYSIKKHRAYAWNKLVAGQKMIDGKKIEKPTLKNIHLTQSWIVSQYAGDYNPWHKHSGNFSGVVYLKLPKDMNKEIMEDYQDHYPSNGLIEFMYGESCDFRSDSLKFNPKVGKFFLFPSYLKHFVYPFHVKGERRSMSFNAHMMVE
jgi:hypothetical protein